MPPFATIDLRDRKPEYHAGSSLQILIKESEIQHQVSNLAEELNGIYEGRHVIVVPVLLGSMVFTSDLIKRLRFDITVDPVWVRSYEKTQSGVLHLVKDIETNVQGEDVVVLEDIVDTGLTLEYLREYFLKKRPASFRIAALLTKDARRKVKIDADHTCFSIPSEFVIGYGLDFEGLYRNLPFIGVLTPETARTAAPSGSAARK